ncbi:hypothetical protein UA08_03740 [Talaromyces atroroseus]|uniref:Zn(2)-C6 fungal-type domain-containing protein n=1 Tax=Talaromyces atroroseus TaxID=1441469 RepID=A0A225B5Y3_TALAT|nr:hypothetical protein UA08_03740 [Talaromyces atroroseus]OKL61317.1 hypothetical protein UA08_03740 [Talaromyces atroroseus]
MSTRRRNGQLSSCEPCRKIKLRCDHVLPVCGRCRQKGQSDRCIYHPAPLTQPRLLVNDGSGSLLSKKRKHQPSLLTKKGSTNFLEQYRIPTATTPSKNEARRTSSVDEHRAKRPKRPVSFSTGFLGPSSYWSTFEEPEESSRILAPKPASSSEQTDAHVNSEEDMESSTVDLEQIGFGARILALLDDLPLFENLLRFRSEHTRPWIFGEMVTKEVSETLLASHNHWMPHGANTKNQKSRLRAWSKHIFNNSASTLSSHRNMTVSEYFSVASTRWESIGLMFAWIGITTMMIPDGHECLRLENGATVDKHELRTLAIEVSETCLGFCDKLATMSDPVSWLLLQHTVLLLDTFGDSDYRPWRKLGELSTVIFALGLHRPKPNDSSAPLFLLEIRRRVMTGAFLLDKQLATLLGRPPRIAWQYCDAQMPLDLPYEDIFVASDGKDEDNMMKRIGPDGWNVDGQFNSGSQARLYLIFAIMREKILALVLSPHLDDMARRISETCAEHDRLRSTMPEALKWTPSGGCQMTDPEEEFLAHFHLEFLNNDFMLHRVLVKETGDGKDKLLKVAREMLTALLALVSRTMLRSRYESIWILCFIGLPCAGVLAQELLRRLQSRSSSSSAFDLAPFPRSEVIQNLSVFASHLNALLNDRDGNHDIALKGLHAIRNVLDHVLSGDHDFSRPNNNSNNDAHKAAGDNQDGPAASTSLSLENERLLATTGIPDDMAFTASVGWAPPSDIPGWFMDDTNGMEFMTWLDKLDWGQDTLLSYS